VIADIIILKLDPEFCHLKICGSSMLCKQTPQFPHTTAEMSSMRNAVQRRNHKERAQPLGREKWGLLEKHKDYSLRAKDHKEKQKRLKVLREKAALANPDEFSFKMMSSRTKNGQRIADRGNTALSMDVVRLLKTQDAGYVKTMLQKTRKERDKLETEIQMEASGKIVPLKGHDLEDEQDYDDEVAKRITFVDSKEQQESMVLDAEDEGGDENTSEGKKLSKREVEAKRLAKIEAGRAQKKLAHHQEARRNLLEAVRERENHLALAERELDLQRAEMSNSVGGINKNGLRFKIRERKR
jgi:U3 small nucleolar RNA-associated protein 11